MITTLWSFDLTLCCHPSTSLPLPIPLCLFSLRWPHINLGALVRALASSSTTPVHLAHLVQCPTFGCAQFCKKFHKIYSISSVFPYFVFVFHFSCEWITHTATHWQLYCTLVSACSRAPWTDSRMQKIPFIWNWEIRNAWWWIWTYGNMDFVFCKNKFKRWTSTSSKPRTTQR